MKSHSFRVRPQRVKRGCWYPNSFFSVTRILQQTNEREEKRKKKRVGSLVFKTMTGPGGGGKCL